MPQRARVCESVAVNEDWEERMAAAWATFDDYEEDRTAADFRAVIDALVAELPADSPLGPLRAGLRLGLHRPLGPGRTAVPGGARAAASARLQAAAAPRSNSSSSLRNIGQAEEGVKLLTPELDAPSDELDDAVRACLALCLSTSAATARASRWSSPPSRPICRATSGRWPTTRGCSYSPGSNSPEPGDHPTDSLVLLNVQSQDVAPAPRSLPRTAVVDVEQAEAALVEHYPRLVRLAYLVLPPSLGRNRRVLTAHALTQRALPRGRRTATLIPAQATGRDGDPGYALSASRSCVRRWRRACRCGARPGPSGPSCRRCCPRCGACRLFPRSGGADELALDQRLSALSARRPRRVRPARPGEAARPPTCARCWRRRASTIRARR